MAKRDLRTAAVVGTWRGMKARRLFAGVRVEATKALRELTADLRRELRAERIRWDRLEQEDSKVTRWSNAGWIQAANWKKTGTDSQFLAQCHEVWHAEFFKALAPQLQYSMKIQGDLISRQVTA